MQSERNLQKGSFSRIYVEHDAFDYPDTRLVLDRFPKAEQIPIEHYKQVLNRGNQNWRLQKENQALILAVRRDNFLYEGSDIAPDFGHKAFYYNALVLNCLYDCSYCYLQGMYPSPHTVLFVNNEDFIRHTLERVNRGPIYLCISYDTDLLAFEQLIPYSNRWIEAARQHPGLTIELRTKSSNYRAISSQKPVDNVILAWTLSPAYVAEHYEAKTPGLTQRLRAMKKAIADGWKVRLCFDPVLKVPGWKQHYREMIDYTFSEISPDDVEDISIGVFRMSKQFLRRIRKQRQDKDVLMYPYEIEDGVASYPGDEKAEMTRFVAELIADHTDKNPVII